MKRWPIRLTVIVTICVLSLMYAALPSRATSVQIGGSEPTLPVEPGNVGGSVFFGPVAGSDLYDVAGDIGATMPVGSLGRGEFYFFGDLFTWVKLARGSEFDPRRIIYTLEAGYSLIARDKEARLFIKHQSFHDVDFFDGIDEGYELYGGCYRLMRNPQVSLRVGKYMNRKRVDYDWDYAALVVFDTSRYVGKPSQLTLWLHHVTEDGQGRDNFTDYAVELGFPMNGSFYLFGRYAFLHDIDRFEGKTDHHFLVGPRYIW